MEMLLWIAACFFASIGIVQCGFWVTEALRRTDAFHRGYRLIPLYDEPEQLEAHLRTVFSQMYCEGGWEQIFLVDMGMGEECREICERMVRSTSGIYICEPDEIPGILMKLDNLQNAVNDVE